MKATGRIIVLTGCTRGLGRAMTSYFTTEGATVAGCGRSRSAIDTMRREFPHANHFAAVDVSDPSAVNAWAAQILGDVGLPDLVINNAAVIAQNAPLWQVPAEEVDAALAVNLRGPVNVLRAFLPAMIEGGRGVIVNFSSGWGRSTSPDVAIYCTTKWGIEGMTRALAQDLDGTGVTAAALNPGVINTEMLQECFGESAKAYPTANEWVQNAGPFLLSLGPKAHGKSLDVPGIPLD